MAANSCLRTGEPVRSDILQRSSRSRCTPYRPSRSRNGSYSFRIIRIPSTRRRRSVTRFRSMRMSSCGSMTCSEEAWLRLSTNERPRERTRHDGMRARCPRGSIITLSRQGRFIKPARLRWCADDEPVDSHHRKMSMPAYQTILYNIADGVCTITINRPDVYNAFNEQMKKELNEGLKEAERDAAVRCLLIRGSGIKAFCSGQDLKEHSGAKRSLKESLDKSYNPMIRRIRNMEKPVIGMINGVAAGAGCSLALASDMRLMSSSAKLIEVFIRIGLVPDSGSHWFLSRLVGQSLAFEYAAPGRGIPAQAPERVGLANKVVPPEQLEEETMSLAKKFAQAPTKSIGLIKGTVNKSLSSDHNSILDYETRIQQIAFKTDTTWEGI